MKTGMGRYSQFLTGRHEGTKLIIFSFQGMTSLLTFG